VTDTVAPMTTAASGLHDDVSRRTWIALAAASASIFLFVLDSGLLSVSLPAIEKQFPGTPRSTLSWVATGYLVALASLLLVGGRIADRRGRKRVYLFGLASFSAGAVLTALAPNAALLIAARVVQGTGGAFMTSSSLALVLPEFPPSRRHAAIGVWGAIGSVAAILAPTVGARVVDLGRWRVCFGAVAVIGFAATMVGKRVLREPVDETRTADINPVSVLAGSGGLGLLVLALSQGRRWGWQSSTTIVVALGAVGLLVVFAFISRRDRSPLLDLRLFNFPQWTTNTLAAGLQQIGFFSWFLTTPLILVNVWKWSVFRAGSAMALGQVASAITGFLGGRWADRRGTAMPIVSTAIVTALGPLWLILTATTKPSFWLVFLPATLLIGAGGGVCGMLTTGGALEAMPPDTLGSANSAHQLFRRVAGTMGVAVALALLGDRKGVDLLGSAKAVWLMIAVAHVAMCLPLLRAAMVRPVGRVLAHE
jgi:EmrB/QacA subfamily drug resistance transporter